MTLKGELNNNWTLGSSRVLRDLAKKMQTIEEEGINVSEENRGYPDILVADLKTGEIVRVTGNVTRNANHTQRIRHKRPPKLVEALLLSIIEENIGEEKFPVFISRVEEWIQEFDSSAAFDAWAAKHMDKVSRLEMVMDAHRGLTLTECSGQTRCVAEISPENQMAMMNTRTLQSLIQESVAEEVSQDESR